MFSFLKTMPRPGSLLHFTLRFFQFILAITVAGLYGVDLHRASTAHIHFDSRWVFAEVVAGLSAISVFVYLAHIRIFFVWDFVMFVLWTALFGVFGRIYIPDHPAKGQSGQIRMKNAVWVDLTNMVLWFVTFIWGATRWFLLRDVVPQGAGRAQV